MITDDWASGLMTLLAIVALLAFLGLQSGYLIARREGAEEWLASRLGTSRLVPANLMVATTLAGGILGVVFAGVRTGTALITGRPVELPPGLVALTFVFFVGAAATGLIVSLRRTGPAREAIGAALAGGWLALGLVLLAAAAFAYREVAVTLLAGAEAGGLAGVVWLFVRARVRTLARHLIGRVLPAPVGPWAVETASAAIGVIDAAAWLFGGGTPVSGWVTLTLIAPLVPGLVVGNRVAALPAISVYRRELAGYRTTVLEVAGDGPPILLLHGFGVSGEVWREFMQIFGGGNRLVAIDFPGVSEAADPLLNEDFLPQLRRFAEAAIRELFVSQRPPLVVGLSLGGYVALDLMHKGVIDHAIVVGTAGLGQRGWMRISSRKPVIRVVSAVGRGLPPAVRGRLAVRSYLRANAYASALAQATVRERARDLEAVRWYVEGGGQLLRELAEHPVDLRALHGNVHFFWGEGDPISPASLARRVRERRPDLPITILDGLHHAVFREDPGRFAEEMARSPVYREYMRLLSWWGQRRPTDREAGGRPAGQPDTATPSEGEPSPAIAEPPASHQPRRRSVTRTQWFVLGGAALAAATAAAAGARRLQRVGRRDAT